MVHIRNVTTLEREIFWPHENVEKKWCGGGGAIVQPVAATFLSPVFESPLGGGYASSSIETLLRAEGFELPFWFNPSIPVSAPRTPCPLFLHLLFLVWAVWVGSFWSFRLIRKTHTSDGALDEQLGGLSPSGSNLLQGYLAHEKHPPPRTLQ